jgi:hypothetical protein
MGKRCRTISVVQAESRIACGERQHMVATVECSECLVRDFTDGCVLIRGICHGGASHAVLAWSAGTLVTQTALIEWSNESADVRFRR